MRLAFLAALLAAIACSGASPEPVAAPFEARVTIDTLHPGPAPNALVLGSSVQWVDRGDELLKDSSVQFAEPMLQRVVALGPTVLRYPGGSMADTYHWKDGIGPLGERRMNEHFFSSKKQVVAMGTKEFLELCEATGAVPLITVNTATGSAQDAADWVTYTNKATLVSSRTGKPLPRVRFWEIGNEPYLQDDNRKALWIQPEAFARKASDFIRAMKKADPEIIVGVPLRSDRIGGVPATPLQGYNRKVLKLIDADFDFVALHNAYLPLGFDKKYSDDDLYLATAAATSVVVEDFEETRKLLKELRPGKNVKLAVTEYQALYSLGKSTDDYIASPAGALYIADALRVFAETGDLLLANFWSLSGNWHFGALDQKGEPRPAYYVLKAYRTLLKGRLLPVSVQAPGFDSPRVGLVPAQKALPKVTAISTIEGSTVRAIVINKDPGGAATVTLVLPDGVTAAGGTFTSYGGPKRFSVRDTPSDGVLRRGELEAGNAGVRATLPPHSVTLVELRLVAAGKKA